MSLALTPTCLMSLNNSLNPLLSCLFCAVKRSWEHSAGVSRESLPERQSEESFPHTFVNKGFEYQHKKGTQPGINLRAIKTKSGWVINHNIYSVF